MGQEVNKERCTMNDSLDKIIANAKSVKGLSEYLRLVKEVLIRFDTTPKLYTKEDYFKLILLILRGFKYLNEKEDEPEIEIVNEWEEVLAEDKVPSEKLVKETFDAFNLRLRWLLKSQDQEDSFRDISFIRVLGDRRLFHQMKKANPGALIFFKDTEHPGVQIISAAGEDFWIPKQESIDCIKAQLDALRDSYDKLMITLAPIFKFLQDFDPEDFVKFEDIDQTDSFGAGLRVIGDKDSDVRRKIVLSNSLVTPESDGAMSAQDKAYLDSIDWVEIN